MHRCGDYFFGLFPSFRHLMITCRAFHLPREITSVVITSVYIPPHADNNTVLDQLFGIIDRTETWWLEAAFVVAGNFNTANMKKVSCPTRGGNTLDHVYSPFWHGCKALPHPPFGKSDHISLLLLLADRNWNGTDRWHGVYSAGVRSQTQLCSTALNLLSGVCLRTKISTRIRSFATLANASMMWYRILATHHSFTNG